MVLYTSTDANWRNSGILPGQISTASKSIGKFKPIDKIPNQDSAHQKQTNTGSKFAKI